MNRAIEQPVMSKIRTLSPQQVAEVQDFAEFLAAKARKRTAMDRLPDTMPSLEAAGAEPLREEEIEAVRSESMSLGGFTPGEPVRVNK